MGIALNNFHFKKHLIDLVQLLKSKDLNGKVERFTEMLQIQIQNIFEKLKKFTALEVRNYLVIDINKIMLQNILQKITDLGG